jgi:hypothetical protein
VLSDPGLTGQRWERRRHVQVPKGRRHRPSHRQITYRPPDRDRSGRHQHAFDSRLTPLPTHNLRQQIRQRVHRPRINLATHIPKPAQHSDQDARQGHDESRVLQHTLALSWREQVQPHHQHACEND